MRKQKKAETWVKLGPGFVAAGDSIRKLDPGTFSIAADGPNIFLSPMKDAGDDLISWPGSPLQTVLDSIKHFWTREEHFKKLGCTHKRGVLLWGPPGSGKTSVVRAIAQWTAKQGGISLMNERPTHIIGALQMIRLVEPKRPIVVIIEEIDQCSDDHALASMLDGEYQVDNVVFVATTNYPERLDPKLTNRPSRFDVIEYIPMPDEVARRAFLAARLSGFEHTAEQIVEWAKLTDGMSLAHVKELIVATYVLEIPVEETITRLRDMMAGKSITAPNGKKVGFAPKEDDDDGCVSFTFAPSLIPTVDDDA